MSRNRLLLTINNFYLTFLEICLSKFALNLANHHLSNYQQHIWIAYSGGVDSRVLLELARLAFADKARYKLMAIHVNHGINHNADFWEQHCYATCNSLNIELKIERLPINDLAINKYGLEGALRQQRLAIWRRLLATEDLLLLAHHLNDQVETMFLRLLRGTGVYGLAGIKKANLLNKVRCIRPLLDYTRDDIVAFAQEHNLKYIEDDSNFDVKFARNFLRHAIFPQFYKYWPKFIYNANRAMEDAKQTNLYINTKVQQALLDCYIIDEYYYKYNNNPLQSNKILSISKLLTQDPFLQAKILRAFIIAHKCNPPSKAKIAIIYKEIIHAKLDRRPQLKCDNYYMFRYRDKLYLYRNVNFMKQYNNINHKLGNLRIISGNYVVDKNIGNYHINDLNYRKVKKIFQQYAIPPWYRGCYSLVFFNNKLMSIIGLWSKDLI